MGVLVLREGEGAGARKGQARGGCWEERSLRGQRALCPFPPACPGRP